MGLHSSVQDPIIAGGEFDKKSGEGKHAGPISLEVQFSPKQHKKIVLMELLMKYILTQIINYVRFSKKSIELMVFGLQGICCWGNNWEIPCHGTSPKKCASAPNKQKGKKHIKGSQPINYT